MQCKILVHYVIWVVRYAVCSMWVGVRVQYDNIPMYQLQQVHPYIFARWNFLILQAYVWKYSFT